MVAFAALWRGVEPAVAPPAGSVAARVESAAAADAALGSAVVPDEPPVQRDAVAAEPAPAGGFGGLQVVAWHRAWQRPAAGMHVSVADLRGGPSLQRARAGADGRVTFADLPAGTVWLAGDRGDVPFAATVTADQVTEVRFEVAPGYRVRGEVVDERGAAVAGAEIELGFLAVAASDGNGWFEVLDLPHDAKLRARRRGCVASASVAVKDLTPGKPLRFALTAGGTEIAGSVVGPYGRPVADARVWSGSERAVGAFDVRTDASGRFHAVGAAAGRVTVHVAAPPWAPFSTGVDLEPGGLASLVCALQHGARVVGRVLARDGSPATDLVVTLDGALPIQTTTDRHGRWVLDGIAPGPFVVKVNDRGRARGSATGEARAGGETEVDIVVEPARHTSPLTSDPPARGR
jgi:hypothetical protein